MSDLNEATVQYGLAKRLENAGWVYAADETLGRDVDGVFMVDDLASRSRILWSFRLFRPNLLATLRYR